METKQIDINGIKYTFTPANAIRAWNALKKAGVLLKGLDVNQGADETKSVAIGAILGNLGEPVVKDIEDLIYDHTTVNIDGKIFKLSSQLNEHLNQYRGHLIEILVQGAMYQFEDFFKGGMSSLDRLMPKKAEPVAHEQASIGSFIPQ